MARLAIRMPKMSMTMTEGEVSEWMVRVGDEVAEGDVVCEVMTDKVDMEVESTHAGTLVEITVETGTVAVGEPIGYLEGIERGFGDLLGGVQVQVRHHDGRPLGGQGPGVGLADAPGRPGDDRDLVGEPHASPPLQGRASSLVSRYSSKPWTPISRPVPDCL